MTSRTLWVRDPPTWPSSSIQRWALTSLLDGPPPAPKTKTKKAKHKESR